MAKKRRTTTSLQSASLAELRAEYQRRCDAVEDLRGRRDDLAADLEAVEAEIAALGGNKVDGRTKAARRQKTAQRGRRRQRAGTGGKPTLVDALAAALNGRSMGVSELADAVQKAGYRTTSANFRTIVNAALIANPDRFKRVGRGTYRGK